MTIISIYEYRAKITASSDLRGLNWPEHVDQIQDQMVLLISKLIFSWFLNLPHFNPLFHAGNCLYGVTSFAKIKL